MEGKSRFKKVLSKRVVIPTIIVIFFLASGVILFILSRNSDFNINPFKKSGILQETEDLIKIVGEKYLLPSEIPTVATVSDKTQLAGQEFFTKAENGDKVLIFQTSKIAILYRPTIDKIINVGPVTVSPSEIEATGQASDSAQTIDKVFSVVILNGTTTVGLTQRAADDIERISNIEVTDRDDAENKPYSDTVVVGLNSQSKSKVDELAKVFNAKSLEKMPENEATQSSDITVILGDDYASR